MRHFYKYVVHEIQLSGFLACTIVMQVRDRATLYLNTLGGDGSVVETDKDVKDFLFGSFDIPLVNLETSLKNYVSPLRFSSLPLVKDIISCV